MKQNTSKGKHLTDIDEEEDLLVESAQNSQTESSSLVLPIPSATPSNNPLFIKSAKSNPILQNSSLSVSKKNGTSPQVQQQTNSPQISQQPISMPALSLPSNNVTSAVITVQPDDDSDNTDSEADSSEAFDPDDKSVNIAAVQKIAHGRTNSGSNFSSLGSYPNSHLEHIHQLKETIKEYETNFDLLRRAVLEERTLRIKEAASFQEKINKLETIELRLIEKEEEVERLKQECIHLKKVVARQTAQSTASPTNTANNASTGQSMNSKSLLNTLSNFGKKVPTKGLKEKNDTLQQQMDVKTEHIARLRSEIEDKSAQMESLNSKISQRNQMLEEMKNSMKTLQERLKVMEDESEKQNTQMANLQNSRNKIEREQKIQSNRIQELEQENTNLKSIVEELKETKQLLEEEVQLKILTLDKMARQLIEMKDQLETVNLQLRTFSVKKIITGGVFSSTSKVDSQLILQKHPSSGLLMLDIMTNGKHSLFSVQSIEEIGSDTHDTKRFYIKIFGKLEAFESDDREEVLTALNDFMKAAALEPNTATNPVLQQPRTQNSATNSPTVAQRKK